MGISGRSIKVKVVRDTIEKCVNDVLSVLLDEVVDIAENSTVCSQPVLLLEDW